MLLLFVSSMSSRSSTTDNHNLKGVKYWYIVYIRIYRRYTNVLSVIPLLIVFHAQDVSKILFSILQLKKYRFDGSCRRLLDTIYYTTNKHEQQHGIYQSYYAW